MAEWSLAAGEGPGRQQVVQESFPGMNSGPIVHFQKQTQGTWIRRFAEPHSGNGPTVLTSATAATICQGVAGEPGF